MRFTDDLKIFIYLIIYETNMSTGGVMVLVLGQGVIVAELLGSGARKSGLATPLLC